MGIKQFIAWTLMFPAMIILVVLILPITLVLKLYNGALDKIFFNEDIINHYNDWKEMWGL